MDVEDLIAKLQEMPPQAGVVVGLNIVQVVYATRVALEKQDSDADDPGTVYILP